VTNRQLRVHWPPAIWVLPILNNRDALVAAEDQVDAAGYTYLWNSAEAGSTVPLHVAVPGGQAGAAEALWQVCTLLHTAGILSVNQIERISLST
jgi:hypothetical protein